MRGLPEKTIAVHKENLLNSRLKESFSELLATLSRQRLPLAALLVLTLLTYSEVLSHTFLINWDDQAYITQNQAIRGFSLEHLKTAFSHYYVGNYAPVQIISYMLDYTLWGTRPLGYLLANILYHYLAGGLLYLLLLRHGIRTWAAFVGTAVFLVHPVQVESVAWLSQRKNLLAMLFYVLAFHAYLSYRRSTAPSSRIWYVSSLILFTLSLLAKSVAVIFPLMLILYDLLVPPIRRGFKDQRDKLPYLLAAAAVAVIAVISQGSEYGGGRAEYPPNAWIVVPCTMLPVLVSYLRLLFWPAPDSLSIMYFPPFRSGLDGEVLLAIGVALLLIAGAVLLYRRNRPALFWYGLFFLGFLPVSQIVPLITLMNDRYLYFPLLGVAGLLAYSFDGAYGRGERTRSRGVLVVALLVIVGLATTSHLRGRVWKDSVALFSDAARKHPEQATTWSRLGEGYLAVGDYTRARSVYEKAASLGALDFDANYNLVQLYFEAGDFATAYKHIWGMLLSVNQAKRAMLLLGEYYFYTGNYADAEKYLRMFLQDYPDSVHGLYELGQVYLFTGALDQARGYFTDALAAGGDHPRLFFSMACVELRQGQPDQSVAALQTAFERGLSARELHKGEACLEEMRKEPRLEALIRRYAGE